MAYRTRTTAAVLGLTALATLPALAAAQNPPRAADRLLREAVRCVVDDAVCFEAARAADKEVIFVNDSGAVIVDGDGVPITSREEAIARAPTPVAPGQGAWANFDFVPGEEILLYDDYSGDRVGDFPRRFDLVEGNWEVVEWAGGRYLRATSNGIIAVPLPQTLPDRFTIEYQASIGHGNAWVRVVPGRAFYGPARSYRGSAPTLEMTRAGVRAVGGAGPSATVQFPANRLRDVLVSFRVLADGEHMKVYLGEQRVANVPNAVFPRSDTLFLAVGAASETHPILIGGLRIAAGGRDLYDRLERAGRVSTQGILFAPNSDRLRPESTATLEEIGAMLREHPALRLRIEGHTDADGEAAYNQKLSEMRAAAVRNYLLERFAVDGARLETAGFGESQPVADNGTPEGKQQNRRVELVRL